MNNSPDLLSMYPFVWLQKNYHKIATPLYAATNFEGCLFAKTFNSSFVPIRAIGILIYEKKGFAIPWKMRGPSCCWTTPSGVMIFGNLHFISFMRNAILWDWFRGWKWMVKGHKTATTCGFATPCSFVVND